MKNNKNIDFNQQSLADLEFLGRELCKENGVEFNFYKVGVSTRFGSNGPELFIFIIDDGDIMRAI